jgi:HK97 family phage major capsid protein
MKLSNLLLYTVIGVLAGFAGFMLFGAEGLLTIAPVAAVTDELKAAIDQGLESIKSKLQAQQEKLDAAIAKHEGQVQENGKAANEAMAEVKTLAEKWSGLNAEMQELAQKMTASNQPEAKPTSAMQELVASQEFKDFQAGKSRGGMQRVELKNTIVADNTTTTWFDQRPGIVPGAFRPLTIENVLPRYTTSTDTVTLMREASFTNNAAGNTEATQKPESAVTFNKYNVIIETIAHWLKVSKQLMSDNPALVSYVENRLRFGVEAKVDDQLLNGDGTSPNLSGLLDSGNYTVFTPNADDNLIQAINRAKWQLWATGYVADAVIVNPADWGAQEIERENGSTGAYLYGMPGMVSGMNPFGVRVVVSSQMPAGSFLIGAFNVATGVWNREGTVVEFGYDGNDFTSNLWTIRAERRLGLEVSVPAALLGGEFTTTA